MCVRVRRRFWPGSGGTTAAPTTAPHRQKKAAQYLGADPVGVTARALQQRRDLVVDVGVLLQHPVFLCVREGVCAHGEPPAAAAARRSRAHAPQTHLTHSGLRLLDGGGSGPYERPVAAAFARARRARRASRADGGRDMLRAARWSSEGADIMAPEA